jgi:hypothetical protein
MEVIEYFSRQSQNASLYISSSCSFLLVHIDALTEVLCSGVVRT